LAGPVVYRALVGRAGGRDVHHLLTAPGHLQPAGAGDLADHRGQHAPAGADLHEVAHVAGLDHGHHAFLRLAHQDLGWAERRVALPPPAASSVVAHATPAAPRSWMPVTRSAAYSSRQHSMSSFSMNGSPTWTLGRLAPSPLPPNDALASTDAPPMPSGPVVEPSRTTLFPVPLALASLRSSCRSTPTHSALTSGLPA